MRYDFRGKLSYSWPKRADQTPLNVGDKGYDPLFAFGYGLHYGQTGDLPQLSEERPKGGGLPEGVLFGRGAVPQGWSFAFEPASGGQMKGIDRRAQEDSRQLMLDRQWPGNGRDPRQSAARPVARNDWPAQPRHRLSRRQPADRAGDPRHGRQFGAGRRSAAFGSRRTMADA